MANETHKCKHELCSCTVQKGESYCSTICEDSKGKTALACDCKHPGCTGEALRA